MRNLCLIGLIILSNALAIFPQSAREKGIEDYRKGNYDSAIQYLKTVTNTNKTDAEAWNTLGMAYLKVSNFKESRKALENAIKQNPQNSGYHINLAYANLLSNKLGNAEKEINKAIVLDAKNATAFYIRGLVFLWKGKFENAVSDADQSINIDKNAGASYFLKSNAYLYKFGEALGNGKKVSTILQLLTNSIDALESCLTNCSQSAIREENQTKLEELKTFHKYFAERSDEVFSSISTKSGKSAIPAPSPVVDLSITPLSILSKPRATYTDSARQTGVQGTITLAVLFSANGNTKMILVIKPLSNGLTEQAVAAAQQIKFSPQLKDGKPISVVKMVQYSFTLY